MNRTEFITAATLVLFAAFLLGWFACWLVGRLTRPGPADLDGMARRLHQAERERDIAVGALKDRDADLSGRLAATEAELETAMRGLRDSRTEIEELRDYIERKLAGR
ncbi:hypothetical protein EYF88_07380 [Paracoccus sediminis]|uniref:Uncharacterized protein n=1 Tax=Paracoccus sediminis TaxID=1214787 RepID=A0A238W614_9RHOB|nr:hypothetical protein [Paracoccus sediminis]TBN51598.1 hypothetical protein EYF88_07380 [Paracoccus sediminis]SNR41877.1 hypothetical protein SAMN06265378_103387 [Paracoccus sediminis]